MNIQRFRDPEGSTVITFPNVKPEEVLSYNADTRIARISLHGMRSKGLANWKYDYVNGKRSLPRIFKDWEKNMVQEIQSQESQNIVKGNVQMISGRLVELSGEYITLDEYKQIMDICGEYGFIYDGHGYFTSGFDNPSAWEWNNDESYREVLRI